MLEGRCHCGAVSWRFDAEPDGATSCNCTVCRRHGALWIYGHEGVDVSVAGPTSTYIRGEGHLAFHFCAVCGCVCYWRGLALGADGTRRMAVNVRLAEPSTVAHLPIDHFDGLDTFTDLPRDGRTVRDMWS